MVLATGSLLNSSFGETMNKLDNGLIEKTKRGYYHWIDKFDGSEIKSSIACFQMLFYVWTLPFSIFSTAIGIQMR